MEKPQDVELRFFGRVAAGFTHELKNVLAIVKETSGLMEDLLALTPEGAFPHQPRFQRAVTTILQQVARGVELCTHMNRFAHSPDHSMAPVDLNEAVDQVCLLAERFARVKGISLGAEVAERPVVVQSCPVRVLLSAFKAYECCWNHLPPGANAVMRVKPDPKPGFEITWTGGPAEGADVRSTLEGSSEWRELAQVTEGLQGSLSWHDATGFMLEFSQEKGQA